MPILHLKSSGSKTLTVSGSPDPDPNPGGGGQTTLGQARRPAPPHFPGTGHRLGGDQRLDTLFSNSLQPGIIGASAARVLRERGFLRYRRRWYPFREIPKTHLRHLLRKIHGTPEASEQRDTIEAARRYLDAHEAERNPHPGYELGGDWSVQHMSTEDLLILAERSLGAASGEVRRELRRRMPGCYTSNVSLDEDASVGELDLIQVLLAWSFLKMLSEQVLSAEADEQQARLALIERFCVMSAAAIQLPQKTPFHVELEKFRDQLGESDARQKCAQDRPYYEFLERNLATLYREQWRKVPCVAFLGKDLSLEKALEEIKNRLIPNSTALKKNKEEHKECVAAYDKLCRQNRLQAFEEIADGFSALRLRIEVLLDKVEQCLPKELRRVVPSLPPPPIYERLGEHMGCPVFGRIYWAVIERTEAGRKLSDSDRRVYEDCMRAGVLSSGDLGHDCVKPEGDRQWVVKMCRKTAEKEGLDNVISPLAIEERERTTGKGPDTIYLTFDRLVRRH